MQNRIDRLEGLVLSLMTNGAHSAGPTAAARALSISTSSGSKDFSPRFDRNDEEMVKDEEEEEEGESETDRVAQSLGVLHVYSNKSFYVGEAHWGAILNDVRQTVRRFCVYCLTRFRLQKSETIIKSTRSSMKTNCKRLRLPGSIRMATSLDQRFCSEDEVCRNTRNFWRRSLEEMQWTN